MQYEIKCAPFPVVVCKLEQGEAMTTESGAMAWMTPGIEMKTVGGSVGKAIGRLFSGESLFLNVYTAQQPGREIAFSSSFPGKIFPIEINPGNSFIVQKSGFLAATSGVELSIAYKKKLSASFFGGEGFIMQQIKGNGLVFLEIDGYCKEYDLAAGQSIVVDTGYLAAMSESCTMDIQPVTGAKNIFFGGEGLFHTHITGPGKVYIQSMPVINTAMRLTPYLNMGSGDDDNGGGINIRLGG